MIRYSLIILTLLFSASGIRGQVSIIPYPASLEVRTGVFKINEQTRILYSPHEGMEANALYLADILRKTTSYPLVCTEWNGSDSINSILLRFGTGYGEGQQESYRLEISSLCAVITAETPAGIFYGIQSLRQLMPAGAENPQAEERASWDLPAVVIADRPAFGWRGMLLDCSRHFMDKEFIKRYLDLLAYYKMNRFHWHLTDDQGWRIEIRKYPKLTEVGAWRKEADGSKYGGYYTQADIREIVQYAAERHIMVIPEIEMPGHSVAALAAYPAYSCTGGPFKVETRWGVFKDIYCAGNDSTFRFLENVLNEVIQLFPAPYIHIGGDEAPHYRWNNCRKCQSRMKKEGIADASGLQSYFIRRIDTYLQSKKRRMIGWDEILDGGLAPGATVQSWRGFEGALKAARSGHDAIVSPTSHAYFDYPVKTTPIEKVYSFDPVPDSLEPEFRKHILGGECNMWTEHAPQELVDSKVFPRLTAMAEVLWTYPSERDIQGFLSRLASHYTRLDAMGVKYGYERNPVSISSAFNEQENAFYVAMTPGQKDIELYYTTDGNEPGWKSTVYRSPFILRNTATVKVKIQRNSVFENEVYTRSFVRHLGIGKRISLQHPYSKSYPAAGDKSLLDGCRGTKDFRDGLWQGYHKEDMDAIIWLGDKVPVKKVSVGFLQNVPSWIFFPEFVQLSISENGKDFTPLSQLSKMDQPNDDITRIQDYVFENLEPFEARYLRIRAKNIGYCPEWHDGAGGEAWLFIDEIIIE